MSQLKARLNESAPLIQVVVGPRQVGKTTAIRAALPKNSIYETGDSPTPLPPSYIEKLWHQAVETSAKVLAIDEVQKISGWSEVIKKLWDSNPKQLKVILSGSAALSIEKDLRESLAGRYELIPAMHWSFREANTAFGISLEQYLEFGCYPGSIPLLNDVSRWASYIRDSIVEPVIGRDILQLHPVEQPALLRQLFGFCVSSPAQIVSMNKLQGQLQDKGALATLQNYLDLLGKSFLVSGLQKFSQRPLVTRRSPPKIIVHDNALLRAFERPAQGPLQKSRLGQYLENSVGARLVEAGWDVYYWRDREAEVDFIANGPQGEKWAIEVKSGAFKGGDLKSLQGFCRLHKEYKPIVIGLVAGPMSSDFEFVPAERVLAFETQ